MSPFPVTLIQIWHREPQEPLNEWEGGGVTIESGIVSPFMTKLLIFKMIVFKKPHFWFTNMKISDISNLYGQNLYIPNLYVEPM